MFFFCVCELPGKWATTAGMGAARFCFPGKESSSRQKQQLGRNIAFENMSYDPWGPLLPPLDQNSMQQKQCECTDIFFSTHFVKTRDTFWRIGVLGTASKAWLDYGVAGDCLNRSVLTDTK